MLVPRTAALGSLFPVLSTCVAECSARNLSLVLTPWFAAGGRGELDESVGRTSMYNLCSFFKVKKDSVLVVFVMGYLQKRDTVLILAVLAIVPWAYFASPWGTPVVVAGAIVIGLIIVFVMNYIFNNLGKKS